MKFAITFGSRYNHEEHPSGLPITGNSYLVVEEADEMSARRAVKSLLGDAWAFMYDWDDFVPQIERHGLTEVGAQPSAEENHVAAVALALLVGERLWATGIEVAEGARDLGGIQVPSPLLNWNDLTLGERTAFVVSLDMIPPALSILVLNIVTERNDQ